MGMKTAASLSRQQRGLDDIHGQEDCGTTASPAVGALNNFSGMKRLTLAFNDSL